MCSRYAITLARQVRAVAYRLIYYTVLGVLMGGICFEVRPILNLSRFSKFQIGVTLSPDPNYLPVLIFQQMSNQQLVTKIVTVECNHNKKLSHASAGGQEYPYSQGECGLPLLQYDIPLHQRHGG